MNALSGSLTNAARFPGSTLDDDRDAMRTERRGRMVKAQDAIRRELDAVFEAAWDDIVAADYERLSDADIRQAEDRAVRLAKVREALMGGPRHDEF